MTEQEVIDKISNRVVTVLFNELDYYMEKYDLKNERRLVNKIMKELTG